MNLQLWEGRGLETQPRVGQNGKLGFWMCAHSFVCLWYQPSATTPAPNADTDAPCKGFVLLLRTWRDEWGLSNSLFVVGYFDSISEDGIIQIPSTRSRGQHTPSCPLSQHRTHSNSTQTMACNHWATAPVLRKVNTKKKTLVIVETEVEQQMVTIWVLLCIAVNKQFGI